jgi:hypothetical protein
MERYKEGKPRVVVAAENMEGGGLEYIVGRLDGRLDSDEISWLVENGVHKYFHTCEEAEKVAYELFKNYEQPFRVRFHRDPVAKMSLEEFQATPGGEITLDDLAVDEFAAKCGVSTDRVRGAFRDEPGVIQCLFTIE